MQLNVMSLWKSDQSRPHQVYTVSLTTSNRKTPEITRVRRADDGRACMRRARNVTLRSKEIHAMTQVRSPRDQQGGTTSLPDDLPADVRFRPALLEEEHAIVAVRRASGWTADTVGQQFRAMVEGRREIWIAECDGYLVGTLTIEWAAEDRHLADGTDIAHISNLVVHPYYRHRGIARGLLTSAERTARTRDFRAMTIGVDEGNIYAREIYERRGYRWIKDLFAPWGRIHILGRHIGTVGVRS